MAYLISDWAAATASPTLFILLDFEKAFDRVDFDYLWATLDRIGLGGHFLKLTKGLVTQATAKIHLNGLFSEDVPLLRAVRQGDPLAPLLFAIATQPLITYLDAKILDKELPAIHINDQLSTCHMFFADDVGIFIPATQHAFNLLKSYLDLYEKASGAKLNLQKSIIIPLSMQSPILLG
jgi:hypothetical protein